MADARHGPLPASTVLSTEQAATCVAFRQLTLLPPDDCLYALQEALPHLSRSPCNAFFSATASAACLRPKSRPMNQPDKRKKFKLYPIGYLQVDFAELRIETGKQYLFVAVDRTSKAAIAELHPAATQAIAAAFLRRVQA